MRYSQFDVLMANPQEPMPQSRTQHQLTRMFIGLDNLISGDKPTNDDWRVCSDAVNLMETLVTASPIEVKYLIGRERKTDVYEICDESGLLNEAVAALAMAGKRSLESSELRLTPDGQVAVQSVLTNYAAMLESLPERVIIQCHRKTEQRIQDILSGKRLPHDVEVMSL